MARKTKAKETIPAVEVGAEVLEQVIQEVVSNDPESTDFSKIDEAIKTLVEPPTIVSPSEAITDVLEEKATNVLVEGENVSSEATDSLELIPNDGGLEQVDNLLNQMETILENVQEISKEVSNHLQEDIKIILKHVDLNSLVKDILYISSLGGEIPFGNYTNLRRFPYQAEMTLPYAAKEAWENRPEESPYEKSYTVNLSYLDANIFANKLVELGKKGAKLDGGVLTTGMMQAKLKMFVPIAEEKPNVVVGLDKFRYTREELHLLDYVSLKALGSWCGVRVGAKAGLIKAILDKQAEVNWS